jgi:hypothetical protein
MTPLPATRLRLRTRNPAMLSKSLQLNPESILTPNPQMLRQIRLLSLLKKKKRRIQLAL